MSDIDDQGHSGVDDVGTVADELLAVAREASAQRASRTIVSVGGLRVTMIALAAGATLAEHESPGAATLHVLTGSCVLRTADAERVLARGCLATIPDERHSLLAPEDTAVLLTVSLADHPA